MDLYLLRHGDAEPALGIPDEERTLTPGGVREIEAVAEGLQRTGVRPDVVFSSPLRRAVQTAAIAARVLSVSAPVREDLALRPGADLDAVRDLLLEAGQAETVMVVGHNPDLSEIAADLVGRHVNLNLEKGGLACISLAGEPRPHRGRLVWLLTPELFGAQT